MGIKPKNFGVGVNLLKARDRSDGLRVVASKDDWIEALPEGIVSLITQGNR